MTEVSDRDVQAKSSPRMRVTVAGTLEFILSCECVYAYAKVYHFLWVSPGWSPPIANAIRNTIPAVLAAIGLMGGAGLLVETLRGRKPATWSVGRWVWSIAGLSALMAPLWEVFLELVAIANYPGRATLSEAVMNALRRAAHSSTYMVDLTWILVGLWVTAHITRALPSGPIDFRELAGRTYLTLLVVVRIGLSLVYNIFRI